MNQLFGGEIKFESELEFVETKDGRKVPFSALSSGQQELLPMWTLIDYFASIEGVRIAGEEIFYIEEPEAHLFPAAQSLLMDFFISTLVSQQDRRRLVLTTHSPYILSKLNNYLKAGALGRSKRNAERVAKIVPKECWLTPEKVKAYAIEDGVLKGLIGDDGLINASYIDEVSETVAKTFEALLDIQYPESAE
jgi:predicted ATP-dependent endonuclease of OLD family